MGGDKYDEIESSCGHQGCTVRVRATERLRDLMEEDPRLAALMFDLSADLEVPGDFDTAFVAIAQHVVMAAMYDAIEEGDFQPPQMPPQMMRAIADRMRSEATVREALESVQPRSDPRLN